MPKMATRAASASKPGSASWPNALGRAAKAAKREERRGKPRNAAGSL